jgi:site-specific DNA-methyltransferase (adenine-specific)
MKRIRKDIMENKIGEFELNKIYNGNCIEEMEKIPENSVDLIITDPPFAINFKAKRTNYNRKGSNVMEGYNEISMNLNKGLLDI